VQSFNEIKDLWKRSRQKQQQQQQNSTSESPPNTNKDAVRKEEDGGE
jgi:hypothetical protein